MHSDRHRVPEISYHRAALVGNRHRATSAAATALYADSLDPKIRMLARPTSRLCGAVPKTPGSVPTTAQSAVYRDLASSVGYSAQRPHVSPFPRKDNGRILALLTYRAATVAKPQDTRRCGGRALGSQPCQAVDNHARAGTAAHAVQRIVAKWDGVEQTAQGNAAECVSPSPTAVRVALPQLRVPRVHSLVEADFFPASSRSSAVYNPAPSRGLRRS